MNNKLTIYSTLLVVVIAILAFTNFFHYSTYTRATTADEKLELTECPSEFMSTDTLANGSVVTTRHPYLAYDVYVEPVNSPRQKVLLSTSFDQTYRVSMKKVQLELPMSKVSSYLPTIFMMSPIVPSLIVLIWIVILVVKLILSIRRGDIFVAKVAKYLEIAGVLLCALYLYDFIVQYSITQYFIHNIHIADHYIVFHNDSNSMYIITGLALMIISQIILKGKDLKEEQELTI